MSSRRPKRLRRQQKFVKLLDRRLCRAAGVNDLSELGLVLVPWDTWEQLQTDR